MTRVINFMGIRHVAFAVTVLLTLVSLGSLAVKGLNFGLDFTGGTVIEVKFEQAADLNKVRTALGSSGFPDAQVGNSIYGQCVAHRAGYWLVYQPDQDCF